jgi:hypothetical protein
MIIKDGNETVVLNLFVPQVENPEVALVLARK